MTPGLVSDGGTDAPTIGVGMGGSCPECRAPLELGQEYCLECGTNVRVRGARTKRVAAQPGAPSATVVAAIAPRRGFPWAWFAVLLTLAAVGLVSFLVYASQDSGGTHVSETSRTVPDATADGTDDGATTTPTVPEVPVPGAAGATPTVPAVDPVTGTSTTATDPSTGLPTTPGLPATGSTPTGTSTTPTAGGATGSTPSPGAGVPPTGTGANPATGGTSTTPATGATGSSSQTSWPTGTTGYTVVLGSYSKQLYSRPEADAKAVAAQQHGLTAGVIDSDGFSTLNAGYWAVFSGVYDTKAQAEAHVAQCVSAGFLGSYARKVAP